MKRAAQCMIGCAIVAAYAGASFATTFDWLNATSGSWSDPLRWSPSGVPEFTSGATIAAVGASYTVTVDLPADVGALTLASPNATLHLAQPLMLRRFDFVSGRITGSPLILDGTASTAQLGLPGGLSAITSPMAFDVRGSLQIGQTTGTSGSLFGIGAGVTLNHRATTDRPVTSFSYPASSLTGYPLGSAFINAGSIRLYADANTVDSNMSIGSSGTGLINRGTFRLEGGSSQTNLRTVNGHFWNDPTGLAHFDAPTTIGNTLTNHGTLNINSDVAVNSSVVQERGTLNLAGGSLVTRDFTYTGGTVVGTPVIDGTAARGTLRLNGVYSGLNPASFIVRGSYSIEPTSSSSGATQGLPAGLTVEQRAVSSTPTTFFFNGSAQPSGGTGFLNEGMLRFVADSATTNSTMTIGSSTSLINQGTMVISGGSSVSNTRTVASPVSGGGSVIVETSTQFQFSLGAGSLVVKPGQTATAGSVSVDRIDVRDAQLITPMLYLFGGTVLGKPTLRGNGPQAQLYLSPSAVFNSGVTLDVQGGLSLQNALGTGTINTLPRNLSLEFHAVQGMTNLNFAPLGVTMPPFSGPTFINSGSIRLYADADTTTSTITIGSSSGNVLVNRGIVRVEGGSSQTNSRTISSQLYNDASGNVFLDTSTTINGTVTNRGNLMIKAGQAVTAPWVIQTDGTLDVRGASFNTSRFDYTGGSILGTMTLSGSPANLGLPAGPMTALNPATFDVLGNLTITAPQGIGPTPTMIPAGVEIRQRATAGRSSVQFQFPTATLSPELGNGFINAGSLRFSADADTSTSSIQIGNSTGTLLNRGLIQVDGGSTSANTRTVSASLYNDVAGTVLLNTSTNLTANATNRGTFTVSPGATASAVGFTQAAGVLDLTGATLKSHTFTYLGGTVLGVPTLQTPGANGATLFLSGGFQSVLSPLTLDVADGLLINVVGSNPGNGLMIHRNLTIDLHTGIDDPNVNFLFNSSMLPLPYSGSGIINEGVVRIRADANTASSAINIGSNTSTLLVNRGTIEIAGGSTESNTRSIVSRLYNEQTGVLAIGTDTTAQAELLNRGRVTVATGATLRASSATSRGGQWSGNVELIGATPFTLETGRTQFSGSIAGAVAVEPQGVLSPGVGAGSLSATGGITFKTKSALLFELASATGYDQLSTAAITNTSAGAIPLHVEAIGGFVPLPGMVFESLVTSTAEDLNGLFTLVNDTGLAGLSLSLAYAADGASVDLLVSATQGDANLDGAVNFDDLLTLAQNYGAADKNWLSGDFNADTIVNFDDLLGLAQQYGAGSVSDAAFQADWQLARALVPEPSSVALLGGLTLFSRRRCSATKTV